MRHEYDDFDRTLLRAGKTARAPARLRARALAAAGVGSAAALSTTKAAAGASVAKSGGGVLANVAAAVVRVLGVKGAVVAAVGTLSVGAVVAVETHAPEARPVAPLVVPSVVPSVVPAAPEKVVAPVLVPVPVPEPPPAPAPKIVHRAPAVVAPPAEPAAEPAATSPPPSALAEEIRLVDDARKALAEGDGYAALRAVNVHAARFPSGSFVVEREALRVDALVALGRIDEAAASARAFVARWPRAPQAPRMAKIARRATNP